MVMELTDTEVSTGGSAMLELKIKGYPKPKVVWSKDGEIVKAGGRFRFLYEDEESIALIIKSIGVSPLSNLCAVELFLTTNGVQRFLQMYPWRMAASIRLKPLTILAKSLHKVSSTSKVLCVTSLPEG